MDTERDIVYELSSTLLGTKISSFFYVPDSIFLQMVPLLYVLVLSLFGSVFVTALMIILDTKVKNQH